MNQMGYNSISLTHYCATVAKILAIDPPINAETPVDWVCEVMKNLSKEGFDRVLIHNPDAVGMWLYEKHPEAFAPVLKHTQITIPFRSPMPSVTPVCFATMYTGAEPKTHGIQEYEKPVIQIDTLFDAVIRAGKKVAIVSSQNASMSKLFLERGIDLYKCDSEAQIVAKAQELILKDIYDVMCVYTHMYDTENHKHGPEAKESMNALYNQGCFFDMLVSCVKRNWTQHNTLVAFSPDHGVHELLPPVLDDKGKLRKGDHGSDSPLDLNTLHYMGAVLRSE